MRFGSAILRLIVRTVALLTLILPATAGAVEVHLRDDSLLDPAMPSTPTGHLPVLFVHGHNFDSDDDADFNYRKNWRQPLNGKPSFLDALQLNGDLDIEPYFIRFVPQTRSIVEDAREIKAAVELILERHDAGFDHNDPNGTTPVQVAIVAYSKGTISTRLYLKSLQGLVQEIAPPPQANFHPVSEFIAISPPNHGIASSLFGDSGSLSTQQLYNGYHPEPSPLDFTPDYDCGDSFGVADATDFIQHLNGHAIEDTLTLSSGESYPEEAPGSRSATDPRAAGILYVTLYADGNRDFVGGSTPSDDCQGRELARNMAPDALNIEVPEVEGDAVFELQRLGVHANTVHTCQVMWFALYAVAYHGAPPTPTCSSDSDVPDIPTPTPTQAAAMLTLDFSGSMSAPACPGCATRADLLKDAVELFVQLWSAVGAASDRLGVTYFRTDVDQFDPVGGPLPLIRDSGDDIIADVSGQAPGNGTAMGGGLQRAIEALDEVAADTPIRRVILFTDGMQNVNPMVRRVGGRLVIANEPGRTNSNVSAATPPAEVGPALGIAVDTIGIGAGEAFVGLLQDIAAATDGHTWPTTDPAFDLRRFFVEELINALRGFSPQLAAYRRGKSRDDGGESFTIEDGARRLVLKLSWQHGQKLDFTVAKDGVDVTAVGHFTRGDFYEIFAIDLPAKDMTAGGTWRMTVAGKPGIAYEAAAIVDTERLSYDGAFEARRPRVGDRVGMTVRVAVDGRPIDGPVSVRATVRGPGLAVGNIVVEGPVLDPGKLRGAEPGSTAAERRLLVVAQSPAQWAAAKPSHDRLILTADEKGLFLAAIRPQIPGVYLATIEIAGVDSRVGAFTRTLTATTVVGFGNADFKASALSLNDTGVADGRRYVTMIVTPRDARGNRLGPGLSSSVQLELSRGRSIGGAHDLGDGRYLFLVALSFRDDPAVTLTVADSVLFAGKLSALARQAYR